MSVKNKKKNPNRKKKTPQAQPPVRPAMSSGRRTLNNVLLIVLCVMLTTSAVNTFTQGGRSVGTYAPVLLLEILLFVYVYATGKTDGRRGALNIAALLLCGASAVAMAAFSILSLLQF